MKKIIPTFVLGIGFLLGACVTPQRDQIDPHRKPASDCWEAYPSAKLGNPEGLRSYFAAARAQLMLPSINGGEDAEGIMNNMIEIQETLGDEAFGEALLREDPETRSAVGEFLWEEQTRAEFPRTLKILAEAPIVKWPSDVAEERFYIERGEAPPAKKQWTP